MEKIFPSVKSPLYENCPVRILPKTFVPQIIQIWQTLAFEWDKGNGLHSSFKTPAVSSSCRDILTRGHFEQQPLKKD